MADNMEEAKKLVSEWINDHTSLAVKMDTNSRWERLVDSITSASDEAQPTELLAAAAKAMEWFAGFPHQGTASEFDRGTATEVYNRLESALIRERKMENNQSSVLREVGTELEKARATHAPMNGHHEGYAVILEELDELWEVCKANTHSFEKVVPKWALHVQDVSDKTELRKAKKAALRKEALQVAAMAVRFIEDVCDKG